MLERGMSEEPLTSEVGHLVEHVWQEALGQLSNILAAPVEFISVDKVCVTKLDPTMVPLMSEVCHLMEHVWYL